LCKRNGDGITNAKLHFFAAGATHKNGAKRQPLTLTDWY